MSRLALLVAAFLCGFPAVAHADVFDVPVAPALAGTLPPGFSETLVWSGLGNPTALRFAPDGRVFVASKSGIINVFDNLSDTTPTQFADLRSRVHDFWDRGLLGLALDPGFTSGRPYVYVLYAYDKAPNSTQQPRWGDGCPSPPGATDDGCVITGRLSRLNAAGAETVLIEDFCQQYPSHSLGTIDFGPDGMLYLSAGDGASFNWADYGQDGSPVNPCGDPAQQGGALRSQSFRRAANQSATLDGAILRVNPDTGDAAPGNPAINHADPQRRRIVAYGLRNPFRFTFRPGTGEIWSGDVGWNSDEEINRTPDVTQVRNYGWPCYEGTTRQGAYDSLNLSSCETLYSAGTATSPYFSYKHSEKVVPGESCTSGSSSISGLAFYTADVFPPAYKDALFFSDYSRNCIWVMYRGANGLPDPATRRTFLAGAAGPVFLTQGPDGALYYADLSGGQIRRIAADNSTPTARIAADPTSGTAPLTVNFSGTGSSDPEAQPLTYAWDLDGDGAYDDSTAAAPSFTYTTAAVVTVRLRVSDPGGLQATTSVTVTVGGPPTVAIAAPSAAVTWAVGDTISFAGSARTGAGASLPASALRWALSLRHCSRADANVCHTHAIEDFAGAASGHFVAPDHEYPSHLLLSLTATDAAGLSTTETMRLNPRTANVTLASTPPGLQLSFASETLATPFTRTVIARSVTSVSAPSPQLLGVAGYLWGAWSDGLGRTHAVTAPASGSAAFTASYTGTAASGAALGGTDRIGPHVSYAPPGTGGVFRVIADRTGLARSVRLYLDQASEASELVLALYGEGPFEEPGTLLATGRNANPQAGGWNAVELETGVALVAGQPYWVGLLNPLGSAGPLRWRDRAGDVGTAERVSLSTSLTTLPALWQSSASWWDGPLSASVWGTPAEAPEPTPSPTATPEPTPTPEPTVTPPPNVLPAPPAVRPPAPAGPVAAWGFDDRRPRRTVGPRSVAGRFGRALAFTGRQSVAMRGPQHARALTVEAWVRPDRRTGIIAQQGSAWALSPVAVSVRGRVVRGSLKLGRWTHLAVTYDGATIRRYVDGRPAGTRTHTARLGGSRTLRLGAEFRGRLDELRIYDRALTAAEIRTDMANAIAP